MAAQQSPLRRWKRFFPIFDSIDAAIVASQREEEVGCAEELRQAKGDVIELLCDASQDDPAEDHCKILDELMVEYLLTLKSVPVTPTALASTGLANAVGALEEHESEKIRGLAREIVGVWRDSVESDLAKAIAEVEELRKLSDEILVTKKIAPVLCPARANAPVSTDKKMVPVVKMPAIVCPGRANAAGIDKMEATKRKLRAGYQEAEDAKRQRKIVVIEAPNKMAKQQQQPKKVVEQRQQPAKVSAPLLRKSVPVVHTSRATTGQTKMPMAMGKQQQQQRKVVEQRQMPARFSAPLLKKSAPVVGIGRASTATVDKIPAMDKMEATKRKLRAGYQDAEDAKRQRKIVVIEAPKVVEQRQRKVHPIVRQRSQARCGTSTAVRRPLMSSLCRV